MKQILSTVAYHTHVRDACPLLVRQTMECMVLPRVASKPATDPCYPCYPSG